MQRAILRNRQDSDSPLAVHSRQSAAHLEQAPVTLPLAVKDKKTIGAFCIYLV
jgi:hypothetical protein